MKKLKGEDWLKSSQKRVEDLMLSTLMAPMTATAVGLAAVAVKLYDKEEPFYTQTRLGVDDEPFTIRKVRTLPHNVEYNVSITGHNHSEASKLGRILRKLRVDEAPQFASIVLGHMSVVGPRPLMLEDYDDAREYLDSSDYVFWRKARRIARPGLIDPFAVQLYRDDNTCSRAQHWQQRAAIESEYVDTASKAVDHGVMLASARLLHSFIQEERSK